MQSLAKIPGGETFSIAFHKRAGL